MISLVWMIFIWHNSTKLNLNQNPKLNLNLTSTLNLNPNLKPNMNSNWYLNVKSSPNSKLKTELEPELKPKLVQNFWTLLSLCEFVQIHLVKAQTWIRTWRGPNSWKISNERRHCSSTIWFFYFTWILDRHRVLEQY